MILYHYTTRYAWDGIKAVGILKPSPRTPFWLCLTTDTNRDGHGLPDGREITGLQAANMPHEIVGGKFYCFDHTECRLKLDIAEDDSNLMHAWEYFDSDDKRLSADITAYHPCDMMLSDDALKVTFALFVSLQLEPKSPTWWYYKGAMPLSRILVMERRDSHGSYV